MMIGVIKLAYLGVIVCNVEYRCCTYPVKNMMWLQPVVLSFKVRDKPSCKLDLFVNTRLALAGCRL